VAAQYSNGISALWRSRRQAKLPFVAVRDTVCKLVYIAGFDLAACLEYNSIGTVLVECGAPFDSLESDDACIICVKCINPPTKDCQQKLQHFCVTTHSPTWKPRLPNLWERLGSSFSGQVNDHRFSNA
jgi:hypothetical protein